MCGFKQVLLPAEGPKSCVDILQIKKYSECYQIYNLELRNTNELK